MPSLDPTTRPALSPSTAGDSDTAVGTLTPTLAPSASPTVIPTEAPSLTPSVQPSAEPTVTPTTDVPTAAPSESPSARQENMARTAGGYDDGYVIVLANLLEHCRLVRGLRQDGYGQWYIDPQWCARTDRTNANEIPPNDLEVLDTLGVRYQCVQKCARDVWNPKLYKTKRGYQGASGGLAHTA